MTLTREQALDVMMAGFSKSTGELAKTDSIVSKVREAYGLMLDTWVKLGMLRLAEPPDAAEIIVNWLHDIRTDRKDRANQIINSLEEAGFNIYCQPELGPAPNFANAPTIEMRAIGVVNEAFCQNFTGSMSNHDLAKLAVKSIILAGLRFKNKD